MFLSTINWSNFSELSILISWGSNLLQIFLFAFFCIYAGTVITENINLKTSTEKLIFSISIGLSLVSFSLFFLGLLHLYNSSALVIISIFVLIAISYYDKNIKRIWGAANILKEAIREYWYLWIIFIFYSISALLPPINWDSSSYHIPYVCQWAKEGELTVDPSMRYPIYTFNFHMIHLVGVVFKNITFIHFSSWLTGVLTTLLIIAALIRFNVSKMIAIICGLGFFFTPTIKFFLTTGYIDLPIIFFLTLSACSFQFLTIDSGNKSLALATGLFCAMLIGMKISNVIFAPLYLLFCYIYFYKKNKSTFYVLIGSIIFFSSFWYLRNFFIAGDPLSPILNLKFTGFDPYWNQEDYKILIESINLGINRESYNAFTLLVDMVFDKSGTLGKPMNGYLFIFPFAILFIKEFKKEKLIFLYIFSLITFFLAIYLSFSVRYAYYIGLIIIISGISANYVYDYLAKRINARLIKILTGFLLVAIFIGPSKSIFLDNLFYSLDKKIPVSFEETDDYLEKNSFYKLKKPLTTIQNLKEAGLLSGQVYIFFLEEYKIYFNLSGYEYVGDTFGKYRFRDFIYKLDHLQLNEFLKDSKINGVILNVKAGGEKISKEIIKNYSNEYELIFNNDDVIVFKKKQ